MRTTGVLSLLSIVAVLAVVLFVSGWGQPRPSLERAIARLRRSAPAVTHADQASGLVERVGSLGSTTELVTTRLTSPTTLRLIGRSPQTHAGYLVIAAMVGLVVPSAVIAVLSLLGFSTIGVVVPLGISLLAAIAAPVLVHLGAINAADEVRFDLRHQLSAYLDMVTMLLAGNTGHEGALEQAARAGDGLLFRELRRRMREVSTTGSSAVAALSLVADDYGLVELEQVASATALSAAEGAPVARTLAAKCSTLRSTLAADQEAKARVRNDKVTPPLVGMALLFMALIIYPALDVG